MPDIYYTINSAGALTGPDDNGNIVPNIIGMVRDGREIGIDLYSWTESRVQVLVTAPDTATAVWVVRDWWTVYQPDGARWLGARFTAKPLSRDGILFGVDVTLRPWEQELSDPTSPNYRVFNASLDQIQSEVDVNGKPVEVGWNYPVTDPDYGDQDQPVIQGGSVSIPRAVFRHGKTKLVKTHWPEAYGFIMGMTNLTTWMGHLPGYVRCESVVPVPRCAKPENPYDPPTWAIQFTFAVNYSPWSYTLCAHIDPRTGKRPEGSTDNGIAGVYPNAGSKEGGGGIVRAPIATPYEFNKLFDTSEMPPWTDIFQTEGL